MQISVSGNPFSPISAPAGGNGPKGGSIPRLGFICYGLVCLMARTARSSAGSRLKRSGTDAAFHALVASSLAYSSTVRLAWAQSLSGTFLF